MGFFIFNDIRFDQNQNSGFYFIDSVEAIWNFGTDEKPNLGYKPRNKEGYFPVPPHDSFKRLVPGYEAPVNLAYSQRNRSAAVRIPMYTDNPKAKRIEFRPPDPTANQYLAFAAMLMAGLDGIQNKLDPGNPLDKNIYELAPDEAAKVPTVPGSLDASLAALEKDCSFLLKDGIFTQDVIDVWIDYKRENEIDPIRLRPHPYEFHLYFDV